ncbi:S-layer homology domain-containing protein [Paenibacillus massiliensis]|uniref:S-layer homology domain-containing protein n=1 Tax=Paenibacillus massiliensis TaxID=225917 RepID=UPI0004226835|nr:S-layer homology domain-containing protein [Paenibacillus massiliensis]
MYSKQSRQARLWRQVREAKAIQRSFQWMLIFIVMITGAIPAGLFADRASAAGGTLTVDQALAMTPDDSTISIEGYVVGFYAGTGNVKQTQPYGGDTNVAIAASPGETDVSKMMPVQLPTGVRSEFGLVSKPSIFQQKILINNGTFTTYFSTKGIRSIGATTFAVVDSTPANQVASVTASPPSGPVPVNTEVYLSTVTNDAYIYYSTESGPNAQFSLFNGPITVTTDTYIQAYAGKDGLDPSPIASFQYTIADTTPVSITDARAKAENAPVAVRGIVTYREVSGGQTNYYIQDQGAGIVIRASESAIEVGDRIEAYGPLTIFNGLLQIEVNKSGFAGGYVSVTERDQDLPTPLLLTSTDFARASDGSKGPGGRYEGMLVELSTTDIARSNSTTFYGKDTHSAEEITIYAKNAPTALTVGKTYERITGVMTYHTSYGLELLPRDASDVIERLLSVQASVPTGGIVKGGSVELTSPKTGATIYYTLNGEEPTLQSTLYTGPIVIEEDATVKAIAVMNSDISSTYTFTYKVLPSLDGLRIHDIQGESHSSLFNGFEVRGVEGIVTSVSGSSFTMQEYPGLEDNNDATSEAIQVYRPSHGVTVGTPVKVSGQVKEYEPAANELSITQIVATDIQKENTTVPLPTPVVIGAGGRTLPNVIDSDSLQVFNPEQDAIDFYESLESMRVQVNQPTIVGPYSSEPGLAVVVDNEPNNPLRTPAGGVILRGDGAGQFESSLNPQRIFINKKPSVAVKTGDKLNGSVTGVLTYANGNFKIQPEGNLPVVIPSDLGQAVTTIAPAEDKLTVATFNVENFSKKDAARAQKIAAIIVNNLKQPDIIGVMEVQDNDGDTNSGNTAADQSFQTLIDAIRNQGGVDYSYTDIAPVNNLDGGAPGANIRVGFLYNPERVSLTGNAVKGDAATPVEVNTDGTLSLNPGRIAPGDEAFASSRKPLAAEFQFKDERVVVIANHFNSKGGDLKPYGSVQPVVRSSEVQRAKQATIVNGFIKQLVDRDPNVRVVALGDFNDFQFSRTLHLLKGQELTNLVDQLPEEKRYSYIYDGNSQTLDHILTDRKTAKAAAIEVVHVNADFEQAHGRVSDHDPLLAQLSFEDLPQDGDYKLRVLHTNDTHAHLDNVPRRITAINEHRNDNTLLVDAGDVFSGTLYFNLFNGLADLRFMNLSGYDAMTFGNHEFDKGPALLADFIKKAEFPFVSSNIDFTAEPSLSGLYRNEIGQPAAKATIYPAIIKEVEGEKIGIFGLTTPDTVSLASPGEHLVFKNQVASANATVDMLKQEGVNKIIAVSHLGYTVDLELAQAVQGIDIIVGGHSHTKLSEPVVVNEQAEPTLIVQTGEYNQSLGQLDVTFNEEGVLQTWGGSLLNLDQKDGSGAYVYKDDPEAAAILSEYAPQLDEFKKTIVGSSEVFLDGERGSVRKKETNLGNLMTDGMLAKVKSIVQANDVKGYVAIQNGGGIRASLPQGDITLGGLLTMMPFGNNLTALKMTGKEITAALENGVSGVESGEGRFPQVSGLRFYYDSTKKGEKIDATTGQVTQVGERVRRVQIQNANGTYSNIDPNAFYIVATNSFMADGGDFYRSMKAAKADQRHYELNLVDYEVFLEQLDRVGVVKQGVEGRIIDLKGGPLPGGGSSSGGSDDIDGNTPGGSSGGGGAPTPTQPTTPEPTTPEQPTTPEVPGDNTTPPVSNVNFSDTASHWAREAVQKAVALGIVNGYENGEFRPNAKASRAEFVVMLARALGLEASSNNLSFQDANNIPAWSRSYVAQAVQMGIISGYEDGTFRPAANMNRTEMTVMLVRALGLTVDPAAKPTFTDAGRIPAWAAPYVAAAVDAGLVQGAGNNQFNPLAEATRAEVVTLLLNALEARQAQ